MRKLNLVVAALLLSAVSLFAQLTLPRTFDLSGGATFTFSSYDQDTFPLHITIGQENTVAVGGNFVNPVILDALHGPAPSKWNDEGVNGISYRGGSSGERGSFLMQLNTGGRKDVTVNWTVRDIQASGGTNYIELQYRILPGDTIFKNVANDLYISGTTPSGTMYSVTLPAEVNNQPLIQLRWIYYEILDVNDWDRLAIDDIMIGSVLPIQLSYFNAVYKNPAVQLNWQTALELHNEKFVIERSEDGSRFEELATVAGAGNSYVPQEYSFKDGQPLTGISFYRLKQVDYNGMYTYSPVRQVVVVKSNTIRFSPMPAEATLSVLLAQPFTEDMTWEIFDLQGKLLKSGTWPGESPELTVPVDDLPEGQYAFRVGDYVQRIVKAGY